MDKVVNRLRAISIAPPREGGAFDIWLEHKDMFAFLNENLSDQEFVLYASLPFTFIYAVAVPMSSLEPLGIDDLMAWGANPWSSWGISTSFGEPAAIDITPPLLSAGSKALAGGEQLIYGRRFDGRQEQQSYYEVLQKLTHLLDLHYVPERRSYCKFNKRGDIEDIIRFIDIPREGGSPGGTVVTMVREILDEYLTLTEAAIVRFLDVTRYEPTKFRGWQNTRTEVLIEDGDLYYRKAVQAGYASYARGFQIVRSNLSKQDLRGRI
jgi:hypothetical protein